MFRKFVFFFAVVFFLFGTISPAFTASTSAQEPILCVSIKSMDALLEVASKYADMLGYSEDLEKSLQSLDGAEGLDRTKPFGIVVSEIESLEKFSLFAFVPLSNAEQQLRAFTMLGMLEKQGKRYKLNTKALQIDLEGIDIYLEQQGPWLFVGNTKSFPTGDPSRFLSGLDSRHVIGGVFRPDRVPGNVQLQLVSIYKEFMKQQRAAAPGGSLKNEDQIEKVFENYSTLAGGLYCDLSTGNLIADYIAEAKPGSETEKSFRSSQGATTRFDGFFSRKNEFLSFSSASFPIDPTFREQVIPFLKNMESGVLKELENQELDSEQLGLARGLVENFSSVLVSAINQPHIDGALSVKIEEGVCIAALGSAEGKKLAESFQALSGQVEDFIRINDSTIGDYTISSLEIPLEIEYPGLDEIFLKGGPLRILIGIKDDAICAAWGNAKRVESVLRKAIEDSPASAPAPSKVLLYDFSKAMDFPALTQGMSPEMLETFRKLERQNGPESNLFSVDMKYETNKLLVRFDIGSTMLGYSIAAGVEGAKAGAEIGRRIREEQMQGGPAGQMYEMSPEEQKAFQEMFQRQMQQQQQQNRRR